jgi:hypothetical protein
MGGATRGTGRADSLHDNKDDAMDRGVDLAKAASGQRRIKARDGQIQNEHTYGDDAHPPPA